jgi:hypothetical protein
MKEEGRITRLSSQRPGVAPDTFHVLVTTPVHKRRQKFSVVRRGSTR